MNRNDAWLGGKCGYNMKNGSMQEWVDKLCIMGRHGHTDRRGHLFADTQSLTKRPRPSSMTHQSSLLAMQAASSLTETAFRVSMKVEGGRPVTQ